ncbi:MAG: hypothetical protein ACRDQ5_25035 [Sciscionella sp.]
MTETVCETSRLAEESTSVFVDASGRRRRRMKLAGYAMAAICGCYMIGVGSVVASNPRSPLASLPVARVLGDTFAAHIGTAPAGGSLLNDLVDHVASGVSGALSGQEKAVVPGGIALSDRVLGAVRGIVANPLGDVVSQGLPGIVVAPRSGSVAGSGSGSGVASHGTTAGSQSPAPTGNGAPPVVSSPPPSSHPTKPQQLPAGDPPPSATPTGTPPPDPSGTNQDTPPPASQPSAPSQTSAPSSAPAPNPAASDGPAPQD